jgi:hypothetical protein
MPWVRLNLSFILRCGFGTPAGALARIQVRGGRSSRSIQQLGIAESTKSKR